MSDPATGLASEATISQKLRDVVVAIHKSGKTDELTLKRVRARAEKELSLPNGFLKTDAVWKQKSKDRIDAAVAQLEASPEPEAEPTPEPTPRTAAKPTPKAETTEKKANLHSETKGVKRRAAAPVNKPKKRRKTDSEDDNLREPSDPVDDASDAESEPPKKKLVQRSKKVVTEDSDDDDNAPAAAPVRRATTKAPETKDDRSESELSSLIDESPKKKPRQKKESVAKTKKPARPDPKLKPAKAADDDPDTAEVKRLQGWLVKCGIRKVWSRDPELSKCDTNKGKISVLRGMLKEVGMDGKYSVEKAAKIKEKREFEKDLAAIQEAEAHWGTSGDTAGGRPKRRAAAVATAKPQQKVVLSDDDEDDEGDDEDDKESSSDVKDETSGDEKGDSDSDGDDSE